MRKLLVAAIIGITALLPGRASAVPDDTACRGGTHNPPAQVDTGMPTRGSYCIYAGGMVIFYIGGNAAATNQATPGPCGEIIVANTHVVGTPGWGSNGSNPGCN